MTTTHATEPTHDTPTSGLDETGTVTDAPHVDVADPSALSLVRAAVRNPTTEGISSLVASATSLAFETLSRLRHARTFHPRGIVVRTTAEIAPTAAPDGFPAGSHLALVRLSRGIGLPGPLPDFLGIAVRLIDAAGPDHHQDLLFATTGSTPIGRKILRPTGAFTDGLFTTLLPYEAHGRRLVFAASLEAPGARVTLTDIDDLAGALADGPLTLHLQWADPSGPWQPLADLTLGPTTEMDDPTTLAFDPGNAVPELQPAGWINRLRPAAYGGSRKGRHFTGHPGPEGGPPPTTNLLQ